MNRFELRRSKAQVAMAEMGVAALQVTSRENYYYLTGDVRNVARLFLPQQGEPTIIVFDEEVEDAKLVSGIGDVRGWRTPAQLMQHFFKLVKGYIYLIRKWDFAHTAIRVFWSISFLNQTLK